MTKKMFCVKKTFFAKNALFLKTKIQNMSKHISRNRGATIKASRKTVHDKVFILGQKNIFGNIKKGYSPKSVYWYQCFSV